MKDNNSKIEWFGIDGFLVILYPVIVSIIWFSISNKIDFVIGKVVPYGTILVVCAILIKYFSEVMKFGKDVTKQQGDK